MKTRSLGRMTMFWLLSPRACLVVDLDDPGRVGADLLLGLLLDPSTTGVGRRLRPVSSEAGGSTCRSSSKMKSPDAATGRLHRGGSFGRLVAEIVDADDGIVLGAPIADGLADPPSRASISVSMSRTSGSSFSAP